jgi:hypothetical protein
MFVVVSKMNIVTWYLFRVTGCPISADIWRIQVQPENFTRNLSQVQPYRYEVETCISWRTKNWLSYRTRSAVILGLVRLFLFNMDLMIFKKL